MKVYILILFIYDNCGGYETAWIDSVWNTEEEAEKRREDITQFANFDAYEIEEKEIGVI